MKNQFRNSEFQKQISKEIEVSREALATSSELNEHSYIKYSEGKQEINISKINGEFSAYSALNTGEPQKISLYLPSYFTLIPQEKIQKALRKGH